MLMGGKARKYWKVGEIHEKFEFYALKNTFDTAKMDNVKAF